MVVLSHNHTSTLLLFPTGTSIRQATSEEFEKVSAIFTSTWHKQKGSCPNVECVFVVSNSALKKRWNTYRKQLQSEHQTVEKHFHGTTLMCRITLTRTLCTDQQCGICGISSFGLDRNYIGKNISFQRFGEGFYLAPNSSKCHDYTEGTYGYRAMLLCDVCPGNKYQLKITDQSLQGPPSGFNSVYGQVGTDLNYPEIVLYNPEAVMPRYIILYKRDGVSHPLTLN